jgi:hypothetical protein
LLLFSSEYFMFPSAVGLNRTRTLVVLAMSCAWVWKLVSRFKGRKNIHCGGMDQDTEGTFRSKREKVTEVGE